LFAKPVIFVVISSLAFALIYSSYFSSTFWVFAAGAITCSQTGTVTVTCCQDHVVNRSPSNPAGTVVTYCTDCQVSPGGTGVGVLPGQYNINQLHDCSERYIAASAEEPPPTPVPSRLPPGVLGDLPTLEEVPSTPPPLFGGGNDAIVPPTGGTEQPPATQPTPGGGANVQTEGGSAEQPPATQDDQDDNEGGGLPTIKNKENVPLDGGVAERSDDEGQEDSPEGAETAGPLT